MCSMCVCAIGVVAKTVEGEAAHFHMSIPDLPRPQGRLGGFPLSRQLIIGHDSALFWKHSHSVQLSRVDPTWLNESLN